MMWSKFLRFRSRVKRDRRADLASAIILGSSMMDNNKNAENPYSNIMDRLGKGVEF